ncbi:hypothetical protein M231_00611 [Tremella mesenterica]|uniref:MATH domain-containing protein n=1 Tax=Tremella mesenterica TaxID=5217 RepID=A0A4Q1BW11_TREME|nr:hypothetical protein M231_00611 [Tremella mesenterica]
MSNVPPPYAPRDHAQVQPGMTAPAAPSSASQLEFAETSSVCLEWRLSGLKAMYEQSRGESKSKCIKSAVFGDADNLWEVLWYPNSGVAGGDYASLYLSCVPTQYEKDQAVGGKWTRRGLWWFRFEIKSTTIDERTQKLATLASKDAADHTFAVKTANWGWQQFAKRDQLFHHHSVLTNDEFIVICTIQAQPQPPAGWWLGMGIPSKVDFAANVTPSGKSVGSGGGLSAWSGGGGASGGVAGGTTAGAGLKKVVPKELIEGVGMLLDDPLYSDVEFIIPPARSRKFETTGGTPRRIYANKRILSRVDYFEALCEGGYKEAEGIVEEQFEDDEEIDLLSDSDVEDEAADLANVPFHTNLSRTSLLPQAPSQIQTSPQPRRSSTTGDLPPVDLENPPSSSENRDQSILERPDQPDEPMTGEGTADIAIEEDIPLPPIRGTTTRQSVDDIGMGGDVPGPKKMKVMVRDAAWSTWWNILYWLYTDTIYFAPLTSSFENVRLTPGDPKTRRQWIKQWLEEKNYEPDELGPRPVSAKAVYRLADKLDLPALKLRAFQHICAGMTAQSIPAEVFSRFSSTYEDIRKVI